MFKNLETFINEIIVQEINNNNIPLSNDNWDFEKFKKLPGTILKSKYASQKLKILGKGNYRVAYELPDNKVLKIANPKEKIQNENEVKNSSCLNPEYVVKVFDYADDFSWIIEEKTQTGYGLFLKALSKAMNIDRDIDVIDFREAINVGINILNKTITPEEKSYSVDFIKNHYEYWNNSEWYRNLLRSLKDCNVNAHDLHFQNWGVRASNGMPVILDLGF